MKGCQWWLGFLDFLEVTFFEEKKHTSCMVFSRCFHGFYINLTQASSALGESSLSVSVTGNLSAVDGASAEVVEQLMTTTTTTSSSDGT
jgi:hypothetical protein